MDTTIKNVDMLKLLPFFMQSDEANAALSRAVNKFITEQGAKVDLLRVWDMIDELGHTELDELAWELNIDGYSSDLSLEAKRNTIKNAQQVQRKRGTKWAVETAIQAVYPNSRVQEWFQYNGEPYHFRILLNHTISVNPLVIFPLDVPKMISEINKYKRASAFLDGIVFVDRYLSQFTWKELKPFKWGELTTFTYGKVEWSDI